MRKILFILVLLLSGLVFISASKSRSPTHNPDEYFNTIIKSFFGQEDHFIMNPMPNDFPDTSIYYQEFGRSRSGFVGYVNLYARRQCTISPSLIYYAFYLPLDTNAYWNAESFSYSAGVRGEFKNLFGEDILKDQITIPYGDRDAMNHLPVFRFFNGKAFSAAFKILYKKPDNKFEGMVLQKIYNATLKDYDRDAGNAISHILSNKKLFKQIADEYLAKAKSDTSFNGVSYINKAADTLIGKTLYKQLTCMDASNRLLGIMLRRQIDGTLPVLLTNFKTVLKDYDPEFYAIIRDNF